MKIWRKIQRSKCGQLNHFCCFLAIACLLSGASLLNSNCSGNTDSEKVNGGTLPPQKRDGNNQQKIRSLYSLALQPNANKNNKDTKKPTDTTTPRLPRMDVPMPLVVPGYADASYVEPKQLDGRSRPVIMVLHGNFDRPEWQCDMWKKVGSWYGWILCPRGVRTPAATIAEDRWTYKGGAQAVSKEIHAALGALEKKYPGAVRREGMVLVGFSLGGILAPQILHHNKRMFQMVFLVEGGLSQLERFLPAMKRNKISAIGLAMSLPHNRQRAMKLQKKILKKGFTVEYVDMRGAGHNYRADFSVTGNTALKKMLKPEVDAP